MDELTCDEVCIQVRQEGAKVYLVIDDKRVSLGALRCSVLAQELFRAANGAVVYERVNKGHET